MFDRKQTLAQVDPALWDAIRNENRRQEAHIELIASENYTSPAVMEAQGSQLTNKYAEGYPGKRYYGGCECVDVAEQLALDRVKQLFGAEAANVQPNSGSQANQAVFLGLAKPGDTILGMSLAMGGHLTHGSPVNMSGRWFNVVSYGLNEKEEIDYDQMERLAHEHKPRIIIAGASAYSLVIDWARFARVAKDVGAIFMVDMAHYAGLIAGGQYPNPQSRKDAKRVEAQIRQEKARLGKPLQQKIDQAEKEMATLSEIQTACEAFLAQEDAYSDANKAKLQQTLAQLAETKVKLEKQEENWLAWQEELEQINHAVETEFRG